MRPIFIKNISDFPTGRLSPFRAVPVHLGAVVAQTRRSEPIECGNNVQIGIWECTPGRWPRQVTRAEFSVFTAGRCTFEATDGTVVEFSGGDAVFFPENTEGIWDVTETIRKAFVIFGPDEKHSAE